MKNKSLVLMVIISFLSLNLFGQEEKNKNPFKAKSISIFKNGTAFFIKNGNVETEDGSYKMTENLPRALFGTFWIHSPKKELKHIHSYTDFVTDKSEDFTRSYFDLLQANIGKKVKVYLGNEIHEGVAEEIIMKDAKGKEKKFLNNTIIVFKTDSIWLSFSPAEIRRLEFMEKPNQILEKETTTTKHILSVDFTTKKKVQPLEKMYLENGINWTPTYLIELKTDKKAKLSLRAEVTNDAEDIEGSDVNFVVGIPNFRYANRLSSLVDFLGMIYPNQNQYMYNNFSNTAVARPQVYAEDMTTGGAINTTPIENGVTGDSDEDLYFYTVKNINLKKSGRGQYPIFDKEIEIAHIYETNLSQNQVSKGYYQKEFLFSPDQQSPVFHSIKVMNEMDFPWTTGSAMVVSDKTGETRPISQDLLKYTPIKGSSYVKLTEAPDIKVKQAEKEIKREQKVRKMPGNNSYYYDLVTVEGKIKVKSYKDKKVDLNIKRTLIGELKKSDVKWLKAERINRSGDVNKTTDVCWETSINGGDELEITYSYKVFVASYN